MSKKRYHSLDAVRGVASLQVILAHSLVAIPSLVWLVFPDKMIEPADPKFYLSNSPLHFFWCDSQAVKVFFVLSGFVLSLPYFESGQSKPIYIKFFIKRIIRLLFPCLAIIAISLTFKYFLYRPGTVNAFGFWVRTVWTDHPSATDFFKIICLNYNFDYIDRSLWTLPPEIKLSLILPFLIWAHKRLNLTFSILGLFVYIVLWHYLNKHGARDRWSDFPVLFYLTFFLLGSYMCKYRKAIVTFMDSLDSFLFYCVVIITILVYTADFSFWWLPSKILHLIHLCSDYIAALAAVLMIILALSRRGEIFFKTKLFLFLGKISFSIYLIHAVVITAMAYLLNGVLDPIYAVGIAFLLSFPLAAIFYKYIEVPSLNFANAVSRAAQKKVPNKLKIKFNA
jgi:peptidoglycan/LPS O-acetylase OafA/YrhL